MKERSREFSRKDFLNVTAMAGGTVFFGPELNKLNQFETQSKEDGVETSWPYLSPEELPKEMARFREVYGMIPQTEINDKGRLFYTKTGKEVDLFMSGSDEPAMEESELTKEIGGLPISWLVILQKDSRGLSGESENYANTSHFLVESENIIQTKAPSENGAPRMAKWIKYSDINTANGYASAMRDLAFEKEYRGKFNPALSKMYFEEIKTSTFRRALAVKIKGEIKNDIESPDSGIMANLLSVLKSLKKYDLGSWNMVSNEEMYGNNRMDSDQDIGVKTMAEIRHYLGVLALVSDDEKEKQFMFGDFEKEGERKLEAMKRYFKANRDYLKKVFVARNLQSWDAKTKYWFLMEKLSGEEKMPIADSFVLPVENDSGGGHRFLDDIYDLDNPKKKKGYHLGHDFNIGGGDEDEGMPFKCIGNGRVVWVGRSTNGLGKTAIIRHRLEDGSEVYSRYGHAQDLFIEQGEEVSIGQEIGTIGKTGHEDDPEFGAHLHLDIAYAKTYEKWMKDNPQYYKNKSKKWAEWQFVDPIIFIEEHFKSLEIVKQNNKNPTFGVGTFPE